MKLRVNLLEAQLLQQVQQQAAAKQLSYDDELKHQSKQAKLVSLNLWSKFYDGCSVRETAQLALRALTDQRDDDKHTLQELRKQFDLEGIRAMQNQVELSQQIDRLSSQLEAQAQQRAADELHAKVQHCLEAKQLGAVNSMLQRGMSAAWEKWQQVYADENFSIRAGGGAIRMLSRSLSMAFEKWQYTAAEMAQQQDMLQGAVNRTQKQAMSAAWEKWQFTAAEMARQQRRTTAGVAQQQYSKLTALNTWRQRTLAEVSREAIIRERLEFKGRLVSWKALQRGWSSWRRAAGLLVAESRLWVQRQRWQDDRKLLVSLNQWRMSCHWRTVKQNQQVFVAENSALEDMIMDLQSTRNYHDAAHVHNEIQSIEQWKECEESLEWVSQRLGETSALANSALRRNAKSSAENAMKVLEAMTIFDGVQDATLTERAERDACELVVSELMTFPKDLDTAMSTIADLRHELSQCKTDEQNLFAVICSPQTQLTVSEPEVGHESQLRVTQTESGGEQLLDSLRRSGSSGESEEEQLFQLLQQQRSSLACLMHRRWSALASTLLSRQAELRILGKLNHVANEMSRIEHTRSELSPDGQLLSEQDTDDSEEDLYEQLFGMNARCALIQTKLVHEMAELSHVENTMLERQAATNTRQLASSCDRLEKIAQDCSRPYEAEGFSQDDLTSRLAQLAYDKPRGMQFGQSRGRDQQVPTSYGSPTSHRNYSL